MSNKDLTALHIEDEILWYRMIEYAVGRIPEIRTCRHASTAERGTALARGLRPDLVVLDLNLPDADGYSIAEELASAPQPPRILVLTVRKDDAALYLAGQPHIAGLLWKEHAKETSLIEAVTAVIAGRRFFPAEVNTAMQKLRHASDAFYKILSPRELELVPHFGRGLTDSEVGTLFDLSTFTARSHRQRIMGKLRLNRSIDLMHWAIRTGLVEAVPPPPTVNG